MTRKMHRRKTKKLQAKRSAKRRDLKEFKMLKRHVKSGFGGQNSYDRLKQIWDKYPGSEKFVLPRYYSA